MCQLCGVDANALYLQAKSLAPPDRVQVRSHHSSSYTPCERDGHCTETVVSMPAPDIVSALLYLVVWCQLYMRDDRWLGCLPDTATHDPKDFHFFQADHILPVSEGACPIRHCESYLYLRHSEWQTAGACIMLCIMCGVTDGLRCVAECAGGGSCGLENFR